MSRHQSLDIENDNHSPLLEGGDDTPKCTEAPALNLSVDSDSTTHIFNQVTARLTDPITLSLEKDKFVNPSNTKF